MGDRSECEGDSVRSTSISSDLLRMLVQGNKRTGDTSELLPLTNAPSINVLQV